MDRYKRCCLRLGRVPTLVVSSPDAARDVLRTHDHICASRSSTTVTRILLDGCSDMAFAPYGDEWRQHCRICSLHLLSPKMVQYYALVREQEVATMVAAICSRGLAAEIDMSAVLFAFSNDILCQIVTGKKFEGRKGLFSKLISENSVMLAKIYLGDYLPWLSWVDWLLGKVARVKKNHKRWGDLLDQKDPVLESILTPEVIKALLQVYLPIFFGVVGSPAREGSFGEKLSSVGDWKLKKGSLLARKRNMSAKFLQAFAADHDNPELQRQIGCMTGIFQMFDRQQILTRRRLNVSSGHNHKTLPSDVSTIMTVCPGLVVGFLPTNQNVKDAFQLDWNKSIGEGSSAVPSRRRNVDLKPSSNHTSIELTGTDRSGLLSKVSAVLTHLKCNVVSAEVWTHNTRAATVMQVTDEMNSAITDPQRLSRIKQLLRNVLKGNNRHRGAKTVVSMGLCLVAEGGKIQFQGLQLPHSTRTVRCLTNVEAFALHDEDVEEVTTLFSQLRNPCGQGAIRYESPPSEKHGCRAFKWLGDTGRSV
ncbi:hypothetical protein ZIOFF_003563 [Zingiber officinale]|uniref:ACT domain-containing protein n=1 Tax=Zingiber officinale TaxID=94328 RepID=A0A8J5LZW3_ZINOF|nr:hypothetical protein ZIOFF_003563 [Zingiber officinale]